MPPEDQMNNPRYKQVRLLAFAAILVMLGLGLLAAIILPNRAPSTNLSNNSEGVDIKKFASEAEFRTYLQNTSQLQNSISPMGMGSATVAQERAINLDMAAPMADQFSASNGERVSQTNVQVKGIDEPDIVKTDGEHIYYSNPQMFFLMDDTVRLESESFIAQDLPAVAPDRAILPAPERPVTKTQIISALPPESMSVVSEAIEEGGQLLLSNDMLIVLSSNKVLGFNVSDPANPQKSWEYSFTPEEGGSNTFIETARLLNGELILIAKNYLSIDTPCPMPLMSNSVRIACTDIYYPSIAVPTDSLYTVVKLNPQFGDVLGRVSFLGSTGTSTVYLSPNSVYITYSFTEDPVSIFSEFFAAQGNFLPQEYQDRLRQLQNYDISDQAKMVEYEHIVAEYRAILSEDDRLTFEQEMSNRLKEFAQGRVRDVEKTGIVKINTNNLEIVANGQVPGSPLNQFSIDEYAGNLRIATTVGQNRWLFPAESVNDLYVLNEKLETIGSLQNLAQGERIYSARFINDVAYLVTFEQIDPFFVIDLSNASAPRVAGELKIPGFSSYLHPLAENIILGVGQEEGNVKLSLFDVSNPSSPAEVNKYNMNEFWTEVQNNHHAFLQDEKHQVFFIPGGQGGYIFSYENNTLELVKSVADIDVQRAIFINDYMYIIGRGEITVLNETDWSTVNTLSI